MKILDQVYMVTDAEETVNASFFITERGTVVIDTMRKPADGELLLAHIHTNTAKPVRLVINTHFHADHTFGNTAFSAPILSTDRTRKQMEKRTAPRWGKIASENMPFPLPEITFSGELDLHFREFHAHLQEVGGHAAGLTVIYIPEKKVLFTSDLIFSGRFPFLGDANLPDWIAALKAFENLDIEVVVPGHGEPCGPEVLQEQRIWLEKLFDRVQSLADDDHPHGTILNMIIEEFEVPKFRHEMLETFLRTFTDELRGNAR